MLFLIIPLAGLLVSMRHFAERHARVIIVLFVALFSGVMLLPEGSDGYTHLMRYLRIYEDLSFEEFWHRSLIILRLQISTDTSDDIFIHIISYIASFIAMNQFPFFFIIGLIYGIVYVGALGRIYDSVDFKKGGFIILFLFAMLVLWRSLDGIPHARHWVAAWMYFFGAIAYFQSGNKKYLFWVFFSPMVHVAFFLHIIPFIAVFIWGNRPLIYITILLLSFFVSLNYPWMENIVYYTEVGERKWETYAGEGQTSYLQPNLSPTSLHAMYYRPAGKLFLTILLFYAIFSMGYYKKNIPAPVLSIASVGILTLSISNFFDFSSAINTRSFLVSGLFIVTFLILNYDWALKHLKYKQVQLFKLLFWLGFPLAALFIFTTMSIIGNYTNFAVLAPPFMYIFILEDVSIKEFLRSLL